MARTLLLRGGQRFASHQLQPQSSGENLTKLTRDEFFAEQSLVFNAGDVLEEYATGAVAQALPAYGQWSSGRLQLFASATTRTTNQGILIEGARTNSLLRSGDFSNAAWTTSGGPANASAIPGPDGLASQILVASGTNTEQYHYQTFTITSAVWTFSCYFKAAGYNFGVIRSQAFDSGSYTNYSVNLTTGAVDYVGGVASLSVQSCGNGWYRAVLTGTATAGSAYFIIEMSNVAVTSNTISFAGDGVSGILARFPQAELGSYRHGRRRRHPAS